MRTDIRTGDIKAIRESHKMRKKVAEESFLFFLELYFPHYINAPFGSFHKQIFSALENQQEKFVTIMAFRGSGKSSIVSMAYVIWSILGCQQKKFIVIAGPTQQQVKQIIKNLKEELENNDFLRKDL